MFLSLCICLLMSIQYYISGVEPRLKAHSKIITKLQSPSQSGAGIRRAIRIHEQNLDSTIVLTSITTDLQQRCSNCSTRKRNKKSHFYQWCWYNRVPICKELNCTKLRIDLLVEDKHSKVLKKIIVMSSQGTVS